MNPAQLFPYQRRMIQHVKDHPNAMVWADMGLGKTVSTLTAFSDLQRSFEVPAAMVFGPKRVIQTVWMQEAKKWDHLRHLRFSLVHGIERQRVAALRRQADIYLINYENLSWLIPYVEHFWLSRDRYPPFQMAIYDEVTKLKNARDYKTSSGGSKRGRALTRILPYFRRRVGLTGEPASAGYKDLFGQYLVVDGGQRLGTSIQAYREAFLRPTDHMARNWEATETGKAQVHKRVADITIELTDTDYLDLPPIRNNIIWVDLPQKARRAYDHLEAKFFAELDSGAELGVGNEAAKINKLLQIASGAAYLTTGGPWEEVHRAKLDALEDVLEEAAGRPLLLGYTFRHEAARIAEAHPEDTEKHTGASFLSSKLSGGQFENVTRRWERDEIPLLCGHPASMGHGLNLQGSSSRAVVWFSLPWSLDLYRQLIARMFGGHRRQGASTVHHILARDTQDEVVWEVLKNRYATQAGLKTAVNAYRKRRGL